MKRCYNCMREFDGEGECPHCGFLYREEMTEVYHLKPGTVLNSRYQIGVVIGFGGFGTVYKAWDQLLKRIVAVKEYYPTFYLTRDPATNSAFVYDEKNIEKFEKGKAEFLQEARSVAKYNAHPNVVHVYDFFEENGTAYFIMEYLDGYSLKTYIQHARSKGEVFTVESAVYVAKSVLNALELTHADGIIHRDVKPGNIYILSDGTVKLLDFGAARFSDDEEELTRTVIITPGYAPPEQYETKSKQGPFTDIYAVGAILYEMLTGIKPEESINRKREDTLVSPEKINSKIPSNLANIIMRSMAIQKEIRFKTVHEFIKVLDESKTKRTRNAKKEIRHRRFKSAFRAVLIIAASIAVLAFALSGFIKQYLEANIPEASIVMWVPDRSGDEESTRQLYTEMLEEFFTDYPQVNVDIVVIPENEYVNKLTESFLNGNAPDLFDSTELPEADYTYMESLDGLFSLSNFDRSLFYYLQDYEQFFPEMKQVPLTFDLPILYQNSKVDVEEISTDYSAYINGESEYLGSFNDYDEIQVDMAGLYEVGAPDVNLGNGSFTNMWSVYAGSNMNQRYAAERVIYYLLSDNSQEVLTVQNYNGFPINRNVWNVFVEVNPDFYDYTDHITEYSMNK